MNININQKDLKEGIKKVERLLHKHSQNIPVLDTIMLTAESNKITLTVNNLKSALVVDVEGEIIQPGTILIDKSNFKLIKKLSGIINITSVDNMGIINVNDEEEKKDIVSNTITIKGNRNLKFNSILSEQFLEIEQEIDNEAFTIPENVFKNNLKIKNFTAKNHFRECFTGVLIQGDDMIASNTHYLAKFKLGIKNKCDGQIIIPIQAIEELDKILNSKSKEGLQFSYKSESTKLLEKDENNNITHLKIEGKGFTYITRLIDGVFPNYNNVIPDSFCTEIDIENNKLQDTLEFVKDTIQDKNAKIKVVEFNITDQLKVKAEDIDRSMDEILPSEIKGEEIEEIGFNSEYMITILKNIDEKKISVKFSGRLSPAVFTGEDNESELYLLVPLRMDAVA